MNDENVKREYTKEELAAISARMKAQITADDIVEIINGFSGPTIPAEQAMKEFDAIFLTKNPLVELPS
jgi:hypothetical protein